MEDEERSLLSHSISHLSPTASISSSFTPQPRRLSRQSTTWRRIKNLNSPISNFVLYPIFYLVLWVRLMIQNFQGVTYRSSCAVCRKRSGILEQLVASANEGCCWCAVYVEALRIMAPKIETEVGLFTIRSEGLFRRFPLVLRVWNVGQFETATIRFLTPKVCKAGTTTYPTSFKVSRDSASDECIKFIEEKVTGCVRHHKECQKQSKTRLPKRVLDVVNFELDGDVKLYESRGKRAKYIALSHSWGQKHTFMTTTANVEELQKKIKLETLPKTFQDAIFLTRKLGVRYLWIDSICILQDYPADWEEECPKMGIIYSSAFLTIAAGSALNDQTGFLLPRSDLMYRDFPSKEQRVGPCITITRAQDLSAPDRRDPLSFRAWAFQELLLSRRIIYFHQQELVFECKRGLQCECMSCSRVVELYRRNESLFWSRLGMKYVPGSFPRVKIPTASQKIEEVQTFWRKSIVPEYSARSISRDSDRLPALSAVAAAVQDLVKDRYLAGIWQRSLPADLAWSTIHNARSRTGDRVLATVPMNYVAPSWCWASVNGPVNYKHVDDLVNLRYRVAILNIECTTSSTNPFGSVERGSITLSGTLIYGTCELQVEPDRLWPYRVELLFPTPHLMTVGFEPDVALLSECAASQFQTTVTTSILTSDSTPDLATIPQSWLATTTTLKRVQTRKPGQGQDLSKTESNLLEQQQLSSSSSSQRISHGRICCLLLYTIFEPARSEWVFMVLGESSPQPGSSEANWERLGLLNCWINDLAEWQELEGLEPKAVTIV